MKNVLKIFLVLLVFSLILFNCRKKEYDHLNPYDPLSPDYPPKIKILGDLRRTSGTISFDEYTYYQTSDKAIITLNDPDLTSSTYDITVKSESDTTGITLTLIRVGNVYSATLGFTIGASSGNNIHVGNDEYVWAYYNDANPSSSISNTVAWFNVNYTHGIYIQTEVQNFPYDGNRNLGATINVATSTDSTEYTNFGGNSSSFKCVWSGDATAYWWCIPAYNYSDCAKRLLQIHVKASVDIYIIVEDEDSNQGYKKLSECGYVLNNTWQRIIVPLIEFKNVDFTRIKNLVLLKYNKTTTAYFDELRIITHE